MTAGVRGLVVGALGLTAMYNLVTLAPSAQGGLGDLVNIPAKIAEWLIRSDEPLIPVKGSDWSGGSISPQAGDGGGSWGTTSSYQAPAGSSGVQSVIAGANNNAGAGNVVGQTSTGQPIYLT